MRPLLIGLMLAIGLAPQLPGQAQAPAGPPSPRIALTFEPNGLVSLAANEMSLREILAEWTRKGGTQFNGADKLTGGGMTVQYEHRPEIEVMNSLLRNASGVVIAPRDQVSSAGASNIGVVFVLATSNPTTSGYSAPAYSAPSTPYSTQGSPDSEIPPVPPGRSGEPPQQAAPPPPSRPPGASGVAVPVVPVVPVAAPPTTPPSGPGRGGDGRGGSGRGGL